MDWNKFLHQAIAGKDATLVREALAQGADPYHPNAPDGPFAGATELYWAVSGGDLGIVCLLPGAGLQARGGRPRSLAGHSQGA